MILPIVNIIAGFVLAMPRFKNWFAKQSIEAAEVRLNKSRVTIGVVTLILGIFGIIKRSTFMYEWSWHYGSSYPQAIIAIVIGLLLAIDLFKNKPTIHVHIAQVNKYGDWIGIIGIVAGITAAF